jgi:hypothetical protein
MVINQTKIVTEIPELHNGDAKFFKDHILTSGGGNLLLLNRDGTIEQTSENLEDWTLLSDIIDDPNHNIEDVDVLVGDNNRFCVTYEKELIDRGKSAVMLKYSDDAGKSWSEEVELL